MSFPSALPRLHSGDTPEAALLYAMIHDTPLGFQALKAVAEARKQNVADPVAFVQKQVPDVANHVLRHERINGGRGLKVDFDPLSPVGMQIARLLGTDAARPLIERHTGTSFSFANCCAPVAGREKKDTIFTIEDQIRWQTNIDC